MVNGTIHCWNLNESTFIIFMDCCEVIQVAKVSLSDMQNLRAVSCVLTNWLPITSILFLIETFYKNIFRCNYLRNEKYFLIFFSFVNLHSILEIFKKKKTLIADAFLDLATSIEVVRYMPKKSRFTGPFHK